MLSRFLALCFRGHQRYILIRITVRTTMNQHPAAKPHMKLAQINHATSTDADFSTVTLNLICLRFALRTP